MRLGTSFTDNYLCDFAPVRHTTHALRHTGTGHEFDVHGCIAALRRYAEALGQKPWVASVTIARLDKSNGA